MQNHAEVGPSSSDESWSNPPAEPREGVEHRTFLSASMQRDIGYCIAFPRDYEKGSGRYPVVYYLHGRGGTESMNLQAFSLLSETMDQGKIPPVIHVHAFGGRNSNFADSFDRKVMGETVIVKELIPHIDATYRTRAERKGRAIQGFSMGGQGALRLAFQYPELFGSALGYASGLVTGAELRAEVPEVFKTLHNDDVKAFDETSIWAWVKKNAAKVRGVVGLSLMVGDEDPHTDRNRRMHAFLNELEIPHEFTEMPGIGHNLAPAMPDAGVKGYEFHARHFV